MKFVANYRPFTQEQLNYIQTAEFKEKYVGKSNKKEFERYLNDTNDYNFVNYVEITRSSIEKLFGIEDIFRISHLDIVYICFDSLDQNYVRCKQILYRYGKFLIKKQRTSNAKQRK